MSVVTVQLGQCGNQIGAELYSTLFNEAAGYGEADRERAHRVCATFTIFWFLHGTVRENSRAQHGLTAPDVHGHNVQRYGSTYLCQIS